MFCVGLFSGSALIPACASRLPAHFLPRPPFPRRVCNTTESGLVDAILDLRRERRPIEPSHHLKEDNYSIFARCNANRYADIGVTMTWNRQHRFIPGTGTYQKRTNHHTSPEKKESFSIPGGAADGGVRGSSAQQYRARAASKSAGPQTAAHQASSKHAKW
jgi:hypothetical protein